MRIAVIGAGPAGLTCARELAASGLSPVVLDKGRSAGGRMATRRIEGFQFDYGAQFLRARTETGRAWLDEARACGRAAPWPAAAEGDFTPLVGVPAMRQLCTALAEGLDVRQRAEVLAVRRDGAGWQVETAEQSLAVDRVVLTAPAPQAARVLAEAEPDLAARLAQVGFAPCYALMAAFEHAPGWPETMRAPGGAFDLIVRDSARPGRDAAAECWVAHASERWSRENLETDRTDAAAQLLAALDDLAGPLPPVRVARAHRWRYSQATRPLGAPFAANGDGTLLSGGDWALGREVEDAVRSGHAMAQALRAAPS